MQTIEKVRQFYPLAEAFTVDPVRGCVWVEMTMYNGVHPYPVTQKLGTNPASCALQREILAS